MAAEQWRWNVGKESLYLYCIDISGSMRLATDGSAWRGKSRLEVAVEHVKGDLQAKVKQAEGVQNMGKPERFLFGVFIFTKAIRTLIGIQKLTEESCTKATQALDGLRTPLFVKRLFTGGSDISKAWSVCLEQVARQQTEALENGTQLEGFIHIHSDGRHNVKRGASADCSKIIAQLAGGQHRCSILMSYGGGDDRDTDAAAGSSSSADASDGHMKIIDACGEDSWQELKQAEAKERNKWRQRFAKLGLNSNSNNGKNKKSSQQAEGKERKKNAEVAGAAGEPEREDSTMRAATYDEDHEKDTDGKPLTNSFRLARLSVHRSQRGSAQAPASPADDVTNAKGKEKAESC